MQAAPPKLSGKREQVRQYVVEQIAAGLSPDAQLPTEQALADLLGVSKSTVRKAFEDLVAEGLIYQEQGRGTFVGSTDHPWVNDQRGQQVHMIGYVGPYEADDRFMTEITLGVEEGLDHDHFLLMNKHIHIPSLSEAEILPRLAERLQGMILLSTMTPEAQAYIRQLHARNYPLVLIDRYLADTPISYVTTDNVEIGKLATEHVVELGHRRIHHLWQDHLPPQIEATLLSSVDERIQGYRSAMRLHGLEPIVHHLQAGEQEVDAWVESLLAENPPTAIFAMCDSLALQLCEALHRRGIRVPEDISVIGVDGNREGALYRQPLTTIAQPKFQIGFKAARVIEDLILGRARPGTGIELQPRLVVRQTTCPPRP